MPETIRRSARPGERDVEHPALLGVGRRAGPRPGARRQSSAATPSPSRETMPQPDAAVRADVEVRRVAGPLAAGVGDADDGELETLGGVDAHQADRVQPLGFDRRLGLGHLGVLAHGHPVEEAAQVATLVGLELARQAQQLAHVGVAARAVAQGQRVQVVAARGDRSLDQLVEAVPRQRRSARPRTRGRARAGARRRSPAAPQPGRPSRRRPRRTPASSAHQASRRRRRRGLGEQRPARRC